MKILANSLKRVELLGWKDADTGNTVYCVDNLTTGEETIFNDVKKAREYYNTLIDK